MDGRHLSNEERQEIRHLVEQCGFAEVIRTVASLVGHMAENERLGETCSMDLRAIAKKLYGAEIR